MKERIEYIDIAKGFGILLVIAGHLFAYRGPISRWIFSFHMPLFFILSGICYKMNSSTILVEYKKKKCKQLLVPFCYLYAIGLAVSLIIPSWRENISGLGLGCVSKVESMTAERKNLQNQKEIRAECRIFL